MSDDCEICKGATHTYKGKHICRYCLDEITEQECERWDGCHESCYREND
jgi:hypothetical protein